MKTHDIVSLPDENCFITISETENKILASIDIEGNVTFNWPNIEAEAKRFKKGDRWSGLSVMLLAAREYNR